MDRKERSGNERLGRIITSELARLNGEYDVRDENKYMGMHYEPTPQTRMKNVNAMRQEE
jgi:hypothetical protein